MSGDKNQARNYFSDLAIPGLAILFAGYYISTLAGTPAIAVIGAVIVSGLLGLSVTVLLIRTGFAFYRSRDGTKSLHRPAINVLAIRRLGLMFLSAAFIYFIGTFGLFVSIFLFLVASIGLLSNWHRPLVLAGISFGISTVLTILFLRVFGTQLPVGFLDTMLLSLTHGN